LSSSNQFWTRIISVTGWGFASARFVIRNPRPSGHRSHPRMGSAPPNPRISNRRRGLMPCHSQSAHRIAFTSCAFSGESGISLLRDGGNDSSGGSPVLLDRFANCNSMDHELILF
jgi:hypothetical protein